VETGSQQQLDRYSSPQNIASNITDGTKPYSYQEWYNSHSGLIPGQEYRQYNEYLIKWYETSAQKPIETANRIRINYLNLLKQLYLFIPKQELEIWYNQVNVEDEKELLLAIPYYARKLRDIALYYSQLRDKVKLAKLQYNLVGSNVGLTQKVLTNILDTYTQRPNNTITIPGSVWNTVPQLSTIKDTISIQIEDYYDFQTYLGKSPTMPVSSYFNLDDEATTQYFTDKGLILSSNDWLYQTGNLDLSAESIYFDVLGPNIGQLQSFLTQKYLGENKYTSSTYTLSTNTDYFTLSVAAGNNFLYWPYGPYYNTASNRRYYMPVALSSSGVSNGATAGETIQQADTIFKKTSLGIEGAWYRLKTQYVGNTTMYANINAKSKTVFKFPFPGYGLSGEDIDWTGYSLSSTPTFEFLEPEYKTAIQQAYWSTDTTLSSITPININDTQLVNNLAHPDAQYQNSDKIRKWDTPPLFNSALYSGATQEAWLYKMSQTDIPIAGLNNPSVIVWPYQRINTTADYPTNLPSDITEVCTPKALTSINIPGAVASNDISTADTIYKLSNYKHGPAQAVECAWLSGSTYNNTTLKLSAVNQPGLNCYFQSGVQTKFIWLGANNTNITDVFKTINHESDCTFANTTSATYLNSNLCTCRSVLFSPFGHPGNSLTDNNELADYIALDDQAPTIFDITQSTNFAWYKTNNKIGWGDGQWVASTGFTLQTGKSYVYRRANIFNADESATSLPNLVVRYPYNNTNTVWVKAKKQPNGTWITTNSASNMVVRPGDILRFERPGYTSHTIYEKYTTAGTVVSSVKSIWSNYDYVGTDQTVYVSYPYKTTTDSSLLANGSQYPSVDSEDIIGYAQWSLTGPLEGATKTKYYQNMPVFSFTPASTGTYVIALTALTGTYISGQLSATRTSTTLNNGISSFNIYYPPATGTGYFYFNNIPAITAVPPFTTTTLLTTYLTPTPGYVINTPLGGWNYNTNRPDVNSTQAQGARPYWATAYYDKTSDTDYKGVISWGTPQKFIDEHNVILQPDISTMLLSGGEYVEYDRFNLQPLNWVQPVTFNQTVSEKTWCTLLFNTTALATLSSNLGNIKTALITKPLTSSSNLVLENYVNNEPVEIYYNALAPFVWNVTAVPQLSVATYITPDINLSIQPDTPWEYLSNRFYPTVAVIPHLGSLFSESQVGGFFTPANLGVSYYLNRDYTVSVITSSTQLTSSFEDPLIHLGGRGLTKQDQNTPYTLTEENNAWLKEPYTSGRASGNIKKTVTKTYQKFIPYQSSYETNAATQPGLVTPTSRQSPWGGTNDAEWTDYANYTVSFAGDVNVDKWAELQVLKTNGQQLDNWATDIFGNQYGLYKSLSGVSPCDRKKVTGNIWTRKNSRYVSPAIKSLSGVFDSLSGTWLHNELVGNGVVKIDVFFDTFYVETTGAIFLKKIDYNYETDKIYSITDNSRYISLAMPVSASLIREYENINNYYDFSTRNKFAKAGETWFFPQEKQLILSVCGISSNNIQPALYKLDINTQVFAKIFPLLPDDINLINSLSSLNLSSIDDPVLSHNSLNKEFVMTVLGRNSSNDASILEFKIADLPEPVLTDITVYYSLTS
jgi:hypothetical protein